MQVDGSWTDILLIIGGQAATLLLGITALVGLMRSKKRFDELQ